MTFDVEIFAYLKEGTSGRVQSTPEPLDVFEGIYDNTEASYNLMLDRMRLNKAIQAKSNNRAGVPTTDQEEFSSHHQPGGSRDSLERSSPPSGRPAESFPRENVRSPAFQHRRDSLLSREVSAHHAGGSRDSPERSSPSSGRPGHGTSVRGENGRSPASPHPRHSPLLSHEEVEADGNENATEPKVNNSSLYSTRWLLFLLIGTVLCPYSFQTPRFPIPDAVINRLPKTKMSLFVTKLMEYTYGHLPRYMGTHTMTPKAATVGAGKKSALDPDEVLQIICKFYLFFSLFFLIIYFFLIS